MNRYTQIMPAPEGLVAVYEASEDGDSKEVVEPILCLAVNHEGEIIAIAFDQSGYFEDALEVSDFDRFEWRKNHNEKKC